ncbi:magnesium transporter CorA family protein [Weissella viridescens]|uniref:magnesium transporter CorA family protein n=1 Tax=Weissella viridescens TaxID=1629 RepID=UPI0022DED4BA|nr:magnesium transporter CorA family protein [Weissella viridescens]
MLKQLFAGSQATFYHADDLEDDEVKQLDIPKSFINDVNDENEAARWHYSKNDEILTLFIDAVVADNDVPSQGAYHTESVAFLVQMKEHRVLMFTRSSMNFLADHIATKLTSSAKATTPIELLFTAILVIYGEYEAALNKLDVLRRKFQNQFYRKTSGFGGDLDSIWTVTNALLYIDSSIEDNEDVIDNLTSQFKAYKPDSQTEFLKNRIDIEAQQAHKMADLLSSVVGNIADSYSSRNDRNLNWIMQILTVYSVVLTIPTIITGFYGQNVKYLPFALHQNSWLITIIITLVLMLIATIWFWRHGYFDK